MRKAMKNNLMEIFKTLYEAHACIRVFLENEEYDNAQTLLADCQQAAIQIGTSIDESEGDGHVTVPFLEEYCEALYQVATAESGTGLEAKEILDEKLLTAENSAKSDIQVKYEIVFMPYKASMWDSLESVWRAAVEDPDCEVYVVPIPYYSRNNDGSFGKAHYEGKDFPKEVPIVHFDSYDLAKRRPDVIYIHNPYDDYNYVTSIAPRFYSKELKKYTDCLVYIPYFVTDDKRVLNVARYANSPGVRNAHQVILQSDEVKAVYKRVLLDEYGNTEEIQAYWDEKLVGLGSPKYDAVQIHKKDNVEIPKEWEGLISDRKVVLYNTHLSLLMEENCERFLPKLRAVLEYFRRRKDVVLLWRPHPLTISTAEAMNPDGLKEYLEIVKEFREGKWGIYDDTPNMERAIALSDAYYGSQSSVLPLYKSTGKPVMIHNINVPTKVK